MTSCLYFKNTSHPTSSIYIDYDYKNLDSSNEIQTTMLASKQEKAQLLEWWIFVVMFAFNVYCLWCSIMRYLYAKDESYYKQEESMTQIMKWNPGFQNESKPEFF